MERKPLYPRWLFQFNHWLMLISLGLLMILFVVSIVFIIIERYLSYEFWCFYASFYGWAMPILLALFVVSSGVYVNGFADHKCTREWENKKEEEEK